MAADGSVILEHRADYARGEQSASLQFANSPSGRTYLRRQHVAYPFHICRPFMVEGDPDGMASLYLQSCAGGIYEDDCLHLDISADADCGVHLTTQASTIVHTMTTGSARLKANLRVGANAWLEMISDPLILFPGSLLASDVRLSVEPTSLAILVDSLLLHDPQGAERPFSRFTSDTSIDIDGRGCVARDRYSVRGAVVSEGAPGVTGQYRTQGTLLAVAPDGRLAPLEGDLRQVLADARGIYAGVSQLPGRAGLWCRVLADDPIALRTALNGMWSTLREKLVGQRPRPRRK